MVLALCTNREVLELPRESAKGFPGGSAALLIKGGKKQGKLLYFFLHNIYRAYFHQLIDG